MQIAIRADFGSSGRVRVGVVGQCEFRLDIVTTSLTYSGEKHK